MPAQRPPTPTPRAWSSPSDDYLAEVRPDLAASPYLFASPRSLAGGSHVGLVSNRSVHAAIHRLGVAAGVPGRHHPHRWRHAYATGLLRAGTSLEHIAACSATPRSPPPAATYLLDLDDLTVAVNHTFDG